MPSIRKHGDKWRAEVFRHGTRASKVCSTKREAMAWGLTKERDLDALAGSGGRTIEDAATHYLKTVTPRKDGVDTALQEKRRMARLVAYFGEGTMLAEITSDHIGRWRDKRLETVSGSTVQREANLLRHLFTLATDEWRWIERNPFRGVRLPKENPPRHLTWTWPLIRRVLRAERTGKTLQTIQAFHIALHTGMRLSEVLAARLEGKVAVLPRSKATGTGRVEVPLARRGAKLLAAYGPFTVDANEASVLFSKLLRELLIQGLTFHDSRASALTWLSRRVDVMTLARISRHKDLKILMNTYYRESAQAIAARL